MTLTVLCPMDFSDCSRLAVDWVVRVIPRLAPAEVTFFHVIEAPTHDVDTTQPGLALLEQDAARIQEMARKEIAGVLGGKPLDRNVEVRYAVVRGKPYVEILRSAGERRADLIVMGTHGRTGLQRFLMGSVAERVVRGAPCTVVTVKEKEADFEVPT
jgi:nucleotide-binding universal stress UspA family protein